MAPVSYARHQFPPVIIRHAVWHYLRFSLSYRDAEDLLAERGLDLSHETVRRWVLKFGVLFAHRAFWATALLFAIIYRIWDMRRASAMCQLAEVTPE